MLHERGLGNLAAILGRDRLNGLHDAAPFDLFGFHATALARVDGGYDLCRGGVVGNLRLDHLFQLGKEGQRRGIQAIAFFLGEIRLAFGLAHRLPLRGIRTELGEGGGLEGDSFVGFDRIEDVEKPIEGLAYPRIHLFLSRQRRIEVLYDVDQEVVGNLFLCEPVHRVSLKCPCCLLDGRSVIWLALRIIEFLAAFGELTLAERCTDRDERIPYLLAHMVRFGASACSGEAIQRGGLGFSELVEAGKVVIEGMEPFVRQ